MNELLAEETFCPPAGEDDVSQYLSEIRKYPRLTAEQEWALAKRCADGDEDAIRQMVNSNLRLVVSVAREYAKRGVPLLDLIQEGSIGLLKATKKFDYKLEFRFSTYATKWIRQHITRYLLNHSDLIRVPAHTAERIRKVVAIRAAWIQENGVEPTEEALAEACDISVERLRQLIQLYPEICSLDAPVGKDDASIGTILEDVNAPQPYEAFVREELNQTLTNLLDMLNDRQRQILQMHYGMSDGVCYSLEDIGNQMGISRQRVRQIKQQAIEKLQKMGVDIGLEEYLK